MVNIMKKYTLIIIFLLLQSCIEIEVIEIPVQVKSYVCTDGWKWTLEGEAIVDDAGNQLMCESK